MSDRVESTPNGIEPEGIVRGREVTEDEPEDVVGHGRRDTEAHMPSGTKPSPGEKSSGATSIEPDEDADGHKREVR